MSITHPTGLTVAANCRHWRWPRAGKKRNWSPEYVADKFYLIFANEWSIVNSWCLSVVLFPLISCTANTISPHRFAPIGARSLCPRFVFPFPLSLLFGKWQESGAGLQGGSERESGSHPIISLQCNKYQYFDEFMHYVLGDMSEWNGIIQGTCCTCAGRDETEQIANGHICKNFVDDMRSTHAAMLNK